MSERRRDACRYCRRPVVFVLGVGWLHDELPQYAHHELTCESAVPVDEYRDRGR